MSAFLEKLRSLNALKARDHNTVTVPPTLTPSPPSPPSHHHQQQPCILDKDEGTPIIAPLDTLRDVLSWQPGLDEFCVATVTLRAPCGEEDCRTGSALMEDPLAAKLIVCHDMMGGYKKDRYVQGHK